MNDHASRIRLSHAAALEKKEVERMDKCSSPLIVVVIICLVAILADAVMNVYAAHKYASQIDAANALAHLLNKTPILVGDSLATCKIEEFTLVKGLK